MNSRIIPATEPPNTRKSSIKKRILGRFFFSAVSMLVINQRGNFTKKATGKIRFECHHGGLVANALEESAKTGEGKLITMKAEGINTEGVSVCNFHFEWSLKVK